jgi:hypothetical protein
VFDEFGIFEIRDPDFLELVAGGALELSATEADSCCGNTGCCNSSCDPNYVCVIVGNTTVAVVKDPPPGLPQRPNLVCPPRPQVMCGPLCSC